MVSGGGPISRWPAVASANGRFILTPAATTVKVFSAVSSALTAVLTGHVADVTAVVLAPNTESHVWTASLDGTLRLWDFIEGTELKSYDLGDAITSVALALQGRRAFVALRWGDGRTGRVAGLDLVTGRMLPGKLATSSPGPLVVSGKGNYIATLDRYSLHVWSAERPEQRIVLHTTKRLTCVALDANEKRVAAGDASGRISVWHGFAPAVAASFPGDAAAPMEGVVAGPFSGGDAAAAQALMGRKTSAGHGQPAGKDGAEDSDQDTEGLGADPVSDPDADDAPKKRTWATRKAAERGKLGGRAPGGGGRVGGGGGAFAGPDAGLPRETLHWHAHAVGALAFGADAQGVYLLSGGQEAVLVAWQLDTGKRTYLPRLAGALSAISPVARDPARYVLTQADNTLRLVNLATMRVECSVHGLRPEPKLAPGQPRASSPAVAIAPSSGALVVAGANALLQFYDALRDRHIDKLQVTPRNAVSLTEQDAAAFGGLYGPPPAPHVSHAAFSADGATLATLDVRADAGAAGSAAPVLQFWDARSGGGGGGGFVLNTQIAEPHRGAVTGLAYHPGEDLAVTTGDDSTFRVWARTAAPRSRAASTGAAAPAPAAKGHWLCRSVGSYRDAPMTAVAFSADGSLVAVAAGDTVTLWDPAANALVAVLPPPGAHPPGAPFTRLAFVPGTPFLAGAAVPSPRPDPDPGAPAGAAGTLAVWDLLTAALSWSHAVTVTALAADPGGSGCLAVALPPMLRQAAGAPAAPPNGAPALAGDAGREAGVAAAALPNGVSASSSDAGGEEARGLPNGGARGSRPAAVAQPAPGAGSALPAAEDANGGAPGRGVPERGDVQLRTGDARLAGPSGVVPHIPAGLHARHGPAAGRPSTAVRPFAPAAPVASSKAGSAGAGAGGAVLLFDAASAAPRAAWALPRARASALLFAQPGTPLASAAPAPAPGGVCPLLILTADRRFTIARPAGAPAEAAAAPAPGAQTGLAQDAVGYEAAFGKAQRATQAAAPEAAAAEAAAEAAGSWQSLFDAPSHVLPPLSVLCPAFLELMVGARAPADEA